MFTNFVNNNNNNNTRFLVVGWGLYLTNHGLINNRHFQWNPLNHNVDSGKTLCYAAINCWLMWFLTVVVVWEWPVRQVTDLLLRLIMNPTTKPRRHPAWVEDFAIGSTPVKITRPKPSANPSNNKFCQPAKYILNKIIITPLLIYLLKYLSLIDEL